MTACFICIVEAGDFFCFLVFSHHQGNFPSAILSNGGPSSLESCPTPCPTPWSNVIRWSLTYHTHKASPKPSWHQSTYTLQKLENPNKASCGAFCSREASEQSKSWIQCVNQYKQIIFQEKRKGKISSADASQRCALYQGAAQENLLGEELTTFTQL